MNITIYICCYTGIQAPHCTTLGALLLAMLLYARRSRTSFSHAVGSLTATCTWTLVRLPCCHVHLDPRVRLNNHNLPPGQAPELPRVSGPGAGSRAATCTHTWHQDCFDFALLQGRLRSCHVSPDPGQAPCCYVFPDPTTC
jgi:hypothetical protein